jgi:hypothetical protein
MPAFSSNLPPEREYPLLPLLLAGFFSKMTGNRMAVHAMSKYSKKIYPECTVAAETG